MNQLIIILIVILLPGIIAAVIYDKITIHSKWNAFKYNLYSFVLGVFVYSVLQVIYYFIDLCNACSIFEVTWTHLKIWEITSQVNPSIPAMEIILGIILSVPIAFFVSFLITQKFFNKLAKKLRVSIKYGDENLFTYYLNAKNVDWIYVRDIENNLTYQGRINSFSENDNMQEIVLYDVSVFRYKDSKFYYSVPSIYLSNDTGKFIIETIPKKNLGVKNGRETTSRRDDKTSRKRA